MTDDTIPPFDRATELYELYDTPRSFDEDLCAHISTGYVVSTPEYFLLGRAVDRFADPALIENPWHKFPREDHNTWLVYLFLGKRRNFLNFVPYSLKWLAWQRRGRSLRFHEFLTFQKHAH